MQSDGITARLVAEEMDDMLDAWRMKAVRLTAVIASLIMVPALWAVLSGGVFQWHDAYA